MFDDQNEIYSTKNFVLQFYFATIISVRSTLLWEKRRIRIRTLWLYGAAVYFFLADDDLQQREWIFCSSVMGQKV